MSTAVSLPPSRSSSIGLSSRSSLSGTPTPQAMANQIPKRPTAAVLPQPQHQNSGGSLTHRLRHLFDSKDYATFYAIVTVHELTNIPQLGGDFDVKWKFRGKRPHGVEQIVAASAHQETPPYTANPLKQNSSMPSKPSLPNLKLQQPSSPSSVSLRSNSTASTSTTATTTSPLQSQPLRSLLTANHAPPKASTLPLPHSQITPMSTAPRDLSPMTSTSSLRDKKSSDPTPLRQSMGPDDEQQEPLVLMQEPEEVSGGLGAVDEGEPILSGRKRRESNDSAPPSARLPPLSESPRPGSTFSITSSASLVSHLAVPSHRSNSHSHTRQRSATTDPTEFEIAQARPRGPSRTTSILSEYSNEIRPSTSTTSINRARTRSTASQPPLNIPPASEMPRKGTTPAKSLRAHTVSWEYELQHVFRIPLGKSVPVSGRSTPGSSRVQLPSPTPRGGGYAPLLGTGALGDSGIKLIIEQHSSVEATSQRGSSGRDNLTPVGVVRAARQAEKGVQPSESKTETGEKTVFGYVNIDLAPFAGLGPTTRKFLLKDSRTNATIRITVDMRWIGGEANWVAPPMVEGHLVTGLSDLTGTDDANLRNDLKLRPMASRSSSSGVSSVSANRSGKSSLLSLGASSSMVSLPAATNQGQGHRYKTYEHHLLPEPSTRQQRHLHDIQHHAHHHHNHKSSSNSPPQGTPPKANGAGPLQSPPMAHTHRLTLSPLHLDVPAPGYFERRLSALGTSLSPVVHSPINSNESPATPYTIFRESSDSPTRHRSRLHSHHSFHLRHDHTDSSSDSHELQPELVIENIFNPLPSVEESPFTFIPDNVVDDVDEGVLDLLAPEDEDDVMPQAATSGTGRGGRRRGWGKMRRHKNRGTSGVQQA